MQQSKMIRLTAPMLAAAAAFAVAMPAFAADNTITIGFATRRPARSVSIRKGKPAATISGATR